MRSRPQTPPLKSPVRLHIIAVGKFARKGAEKALFDTYSGRLKAPFSLDVIEVEEKKSLPPAELKRREGALLLDRTPDGAVIVALDEKGKSLKSTLFAEKLGVWRDEGIRDVAFVIGGADGLDDAVKAKADLTLNLGAMTWPHMLVRTLIAEQIYRAQCILSGHPYHRE